MESKRTSFLAALAVLWRAGIGGKLFMALILLLLVGLADAGPRYARFFEAIYGASGATIQPIHVPPSMPQFASMNFAESFTDGLERKIRQVQDSLRDLGYEKAGNSPNGFEMLALRPDFELSDSHRPLDSSRAMLFLDARLECGCERSGYFHLIRFVIDPVTLEVTALRDEQVSWYQYLSKNLPKRTS